MNPQMGKSPHGAMRRKDREITDRAEIDAIIHAGRVMHLALADNNIPFVFPLCYAYDGAALFFHSATAGTKIDILKRNPVVCFEISLDHELIKGESVCAFAMRHRTVIGYGCAAFVDDGAAKIDALNRIVARFDGAAFEYPPESLTRTLIVRIDIESVKGKKHTG